MNDTTRSSAAVLARSARSSTGIGRTDCLLKEDSRVDRGSRAGWARLSTGRGSGQGSWQPRPKEIDKNVSLSCSSRQDGRSCATDLIWTGYAFVEQGRRVVLAGFRRSVASSPVGRRTESEPLRLAFKTPTNWHLSVETRSMRETR